MSKQLGLDLPSVPALGREDFLLAPSNALAVSLIEAWPNWSAGKLVMSGPKGSGKTHLAHVWAAQAQARMVNARDVADADIPDLANGPVAVEDVPEIAGHHDAETALFHLHNLMRAQGQPDRDACTCVGCRSTRNIEAARNLVLQWSFHQIVDEQA
jgi:chromosomal replication initiation ATPase DnaA